MKQEELNIIQRDNSMINVTSSGDFKNTEKFLKNIEKRKYILDVLDKYAQEGVKALMEATPYRTGKTASSWDYEIEDTSDGFIIHWINTNINQNVNIAVLIQTGHGNIRGGYIQGIDYINPAMRPIFEKIADEMWKGVTSA